MLRTIILKRTAAILIAVSMFTVLMSGCETKVTTTPSSKTSTLTSSGQSSSSEVTSSEPTSSVVTSSGILSAITSSSISSTVNSIKNSSKITSAVKPTSSAKTSSTAKPKSNTSMIVKNMNGRTIIWGINKGTTTNATAADKHADRFMARVADFEKTYNCKIELSYINNESTAIDGVQTVKNSIMAGKPMVDIWWQNGFSGEFLPHYVASLLQPLEPLKCIDFSTLDNIANNSMQINGQHYGISQGAGEGLGFGMATMMFYRADILRQSGVPANMMPEALVANNQWTWDNWAKICQKVVAAGKIGFGDKNCTGNMGQNLSLYQVMCSTYGSDLLTQDSKTKAVTFNGGSTGCMNALSYYTTLVKDKVVQVSTNKGDIGMKMNDSDNVAFTTSEMWCTMWLYPRWGSDASKENWSMTYLPKVKASDSYTVVGKSINGGSSIPWGVKNPADAATLLGNFPPETNLGVLKSEELDQYKVWVNASNGATIVKYQKAIMDIVLSKGMTTNTIFELGIGPGVMTDWLFNVAKIANGQLDANSAIKANTGKYNNLLKDLFVVR